MNSESHQNIHGTGLVYDGAGLLIRGPAGSGKSILALSLLEFADMANIDAVLVGDDQLNIFIRNGQLLMEVPKTIAGRIELRGSGILTRPYTQTSKIDLIVDLVPEFERMPDAGAFSTQLRGIDLPRCPVPDNALIDISHQRLLVCEAIVNAKTRYKQSL